MSPRLPLRVAVLGCGDLALNVHLPLLGADRRARVVAVAEPDPVRAQAARAVTHGARHVEAWADAVARDDVDAVVVCLPSALHAPAALAALGAGKHVYVEKPVALDVADAVRLAAEWGRRGVVAMTGFNYRYNPLYRALRDAVRAQRAGDLVCVRTAFAAAPPALPAWKRQRATGGGVLLDLASHHVDLLRFVLGREPARVHATVRSVRAPEDTALVEIEFADGPAAQSFFSLSAVEEDRVEVYGRAGRLTVDRNRSAGVEFADARFGGAARLVRRGAAAAPAAARGVAYALRKRREPWHEPSFRVALGHFVAAAHGAAPLDPDAPTLDDGLVCARVIDAAERSARDGAAVELEAHPTPHPRTEYRASSA